jgi:hypothetical protein
VDLASYSLEGETRPTTEGLSSLGRSVKLGRYGPGPPWRLFLKLPPRKVPARLDTQQLTTGMVWIEGIAIAIPCRFFFVVKKEVGVLCVDREQRLHPLLPAQCVGRPDALPPMGVQSAPCQCSEAGNQGEFLVLQFILSVQHCSPAFDCASSIYCCKNRCAVHYF